MGMLRFGLTYGEVLALRMNLPPEVKKRNEEWEKRQLLNPVETEKVEGNLRMTKIRRTIPITSHYYANANGNGGEHPNQ